jgi:PAS domain S-box-containing protein
MVSKSYKPKKSKCSAKPEQNHPPVKSELEQIIDVSNDAIRIINKYFTVLRINKAFAEITGVDSDAVIGKKCWEAFPSPLCHTPECRLQRILNGEQSIQVEIERKKKDSTTIPCLVTTSPLTDDTGELAGIIEQFRDITEHRRMEGEIKETKDRYRALIEVGNEAGEAIVMLQDLDGKEGIQSFVSDQWSCITGYSREELLGHCFFDLLINKDRQASLKRHRVKMSGKACPGLFEMTIIRKDQIEIPIELTGAYTTYLGKPANVLYIRDITLRKKAEYELANERDRYRSLFENVPVAIWETDYTEIKKYFNNLKSTGITDFRDYFKKNPEEPINIARMQQVIGLNHAALDLFEIETTEEYIRMFERPRYPDTNAQNVGNIDKSTSGDIDYVTHPLILAALTELYVPIAEEQTHFDYENLILTVKGNMKYIHNNFSVAPGCEKTLSRVFISEHDITARKLAEDRLQLYLDNLEDLIDDRTTSLKQEIELRKQTEKQLETELEKRIFFTRAIVHELRTPLTTALGASEILSLNLPEGVNRRLAQNLYHSTKQLSVRINELMDVARGEIGMLKLNTQPVNLKTLLKKINDEFSPVLKDRSAILVMQVSSELSEVIIDQERIEQIIQNLINNALVHSHPGINVKITARQLAKRVQIDVKDTGPGIKEEMQKHLFEMYYKSDGEIDNLSGLRIGLALCKILVELHGGEIWVKSIPGEGSTFSFTIPLAQGKPAVGEL